MQWVFLLLAGFLEVGWTFGLKYSEGFTQLVPSIITIVLLAASFMLFARAMRTIEIGVAYAMFTGIGTVGTVIAGIIVLNEPADFWRLFFIALLVGGIVGLKLVSKEKPLPTKEGKTDLIDQDAAAPANSISKNIKDHEKVGI